MPGYSDDFDGGPLAAFHDVVVVTINYRLGPFGKRLLCLWFLNISVKFTSALKYNVYIIWR